MIKKIYNNRINRKALMSLLALLLLVFSTKTSFALTGATGSHDPSTITKSGSQYWMFTTGNGIYAANSTDLIKWTPGPVTIFPRNGQGVQTFPAWITTYVPGFKGEFWAPDCIFMNGKYYLYYSCSTFGGIRSAIGVATSPTLDPTSPNYLWTDLGMVVKSDTSTIASVVTATVNAIDPAVFKNTSGKVYMSFGSFHGGIGVTEIDTLTGKLKTGATIIKIAGGNDVDWEAPYIIQQGTYYYLFVNRGYCCRGLTSTYSIVMGRSTSINGPYMDMAATPKDLKAGGGTTVLATSGKYIGPGHVGLLRENGNNFISIHYYDGNDNGNPKLDILNLGFNNNWPFLTRDWIATGQYKIVNKNSSMVWDAWGCTGASGQRIAQGTYSGLTCQKWNLAPIGDGVYKITNSLGGLSADIYNCSPNLGARLQLYAWGNTNCQKFKIERAYDGSHVFTSLTGVNVVEVRNAGTTAGDSLRLWDYNGATCQRWTIAAPTARLAFSAYDTQVIQDVNKGSSAYPNPSTGAFKVTSVGDFTFTVTDLNSRHMENGKGFNETIVGEQLTPGIYILNVRNKYGISKLKLIKK